MQRVLAPTTLPQNRKIQGNPCKASDLTLISFAELESPKAGPMPALPSSLRDGSKLIRSAGKGEGEGRGGQGHWTRLWTHDGTAMTASLLLLYANYPAAVNSTTSFALTLKVALRAPRKPRHYSEDSSLCWSSCHRWGGGGSAPKQGLKDVALRGMVKALQRR